MEKKYKIYAIVDVTTDLPVYIGSTSRTLKQRFAGHCYCPTSAMYNDINTYGKDRYTIVQLDSADTKADALKKESMLTRHFKSFCELKNVDIGNEKSDAHKQKISDAKKGVSNEKLKRKIYCPDTDEIFDGISDASRKYGIPAGNIAFVCQNKRKTAGKKHWKYVD